MSASFNARVARKSSGLAFRRLMPSLNRIGNPLEIQMTFFLPRTPARCEAMPSIAPVVAFTRRSSEKALDVIFGPRHPSLDFSVEVPQAHFDAPHELVLRASKRDRRASVDALHCLDQRLRVAGEVVEHQHFVRLENVEAHTVLGTELSSGTRKMWLRAIV